MLWEGTVVLLANRIRPFVITALAGCLTCCALPAMASAQDQPALGRPPWTTSRVYGAPVAPSPYRLAPAFPDFRFDLPTSIEVVPGLNQLLVTERGGKVFTFGTAGEAAAARTRSLVIDLRESLPAPLAGQSVSLLDAEFHPKFAENRQLFVCYVHPDNGGHTRVSRFTLTGQEELRAAPGSEQVVITWPTGGHNAGCLEFGADGKLYIATGDGSGPNPPDGLTTGQDVSDLLGAILRIDIDQRTGEQPYAIPSDNPFVGMTGARPEVWAYGLRNPWKFGVDSQSGEIFAADNGWESWEMVHRIARGGNCGWPVMEGRAALRSEVGIGPTPIIPPIKDHPHTEANSVIGGPVYRGEKLADLNGAFVYGDYITGTIWAIRGDKDGAVSHSTLVDTDQRIVAFCEGRGGELYVLDYDLTGQIYELLPSQKQDNSARFPKRLSETGLFTSLETMTPAAGVAPYSICAEPWMDGAKAERWVAIPGGETIELAAGDGQAARYPEGTVLVKHLELPQGAGAPQGASAAIRLETQLLHFEDGVWNPYSYLWDEAGHDAHLVAAIGANRTLQVADPAAGGGVRERTWRVSATNECKLCHNAGPRFVLGFVRTQLDHNLPPGETGTQLASLMNRGVLSKTAGAATQEPSLVNPRDATQSLDDRARSYLHANCSMCHHPGGNAIVSFFLRRDLPLEKLNTNKGTGIGTFGIRDARIIAPGDPYRSLLLYRMAKLGYARMPYIGSQVVDGAGVTLVEDWIKSLPADATASQSAPLTGDSAAERALSRITSTASSRSEREAASGELLTSTEGALALVGRLHRGTLAADELQSAAALGSKSPRGDIRGLFDTFVPESQRRATLGAKVDPQTILNRQGDWQRGKLIFFSDGARCRACHEIDDPSQSLGPTLQEINKKYAGAAEMLQHVLQPSLKIDDAHAAYGVETSDGRTIQGLLAEQNDKAIVIKTADKKLVKLARSEITAMQRSQKSLMPDGILSDQTAQEAADLLAYIRSLAAAR